MFNMFKHASVQVDHRTVFLHRYLPQPSKYQYYVKFVMRIEHYSYRKAIVSHYSVIYVKAINVNQKEGKDTY